MMLKKPRVSGRKNRPPSSKLSLKVIQSMSVAEIELGGYLLMTSEVEALQIIQDQTRPLNERRLAAAVLEAAQTGDWDMISPLVDRVIDHNESTKLEGEETDEH
jgi:hypothetical protein